MQRTLPFLSMGYTDKGATAMRIWGYITRGVYMLGKPEYTKGKGLEKIRLEDLNRLIRQGMVDSIHKKLTKVEVA